jgi:hypothetical protein
MALTAGATLLNTISRTVSDSGFKAGAQHAVLTRVSKTRIS